MMAEFTRVFDIIDYRLANYADKKTLNNFVNGKWSGYGIKDVQNKVNTISAWLLENGFEKRDSISFNPKISRPEWMMVDFACQQVGVIVVPMHPTASISEVEFILNETEAKACITADSGIYYKVSPLLEKLDSLKHVFHLEAKTPGYFQACTVKKISAASLEAIEKIKQTIDQEDIFTIMYTSGTSGTPKGVMLSHANVMSNIKALLNLLPLKNGERVLSFLPFSHIFERTACYAYLTLGVELYFSQNRESFTHDFKTVQPVFCTAVPRILEKMYDFLQEQRLEKSAIKKWLIKWAMSVGKKFKESDSYNPLYAIKLFLAKFLVLNHWKKGMGGKLRYMAVGAATLRPEIGRLFSASGIKIREGYGMTETSPLISLNRYDNTTNKFGTVGIPLENIQVKIDTPIDEDNEGEILVKGANVMKSYFKRPEQTQEVFTQDGWFRTGDVGRFVNEKFLKITGRKKEIFKTSSGKYIAPEPLQDHFNASEFIQQSLIIGFQRPYITALIVPYFSLLEKWCARENIHWTSPQFMVHNIKVAALLKNEIDQRNETLPNYKRVRNFTLCHKEWTTETGGITSTYKIKRGELAGIFKKEIDKMYK